jgi:hypothetical protein
MSARLYTAHLAPGQAADETLLIGDGWRWGAFLFPLIWAIWHRHWLLAAALSCMGLGFAGLAGMGQPGVALVLEAGLRLWLGLEGAEMARLDRRFRGWRELGSVSARAEDEAALIWFRVRQA